METVRPCGCKGIRTCLICEKKYGISKAYIVEDLQNQKSYIYCPDCNKAWPGWNEADNKHPHHEGEPIDYPGVYIQPDFLTEDEADSLIKSLDSLPWEPSQSGRRKQNYGPKCNFKKRRLRVGDFCGFPANTKFVQEKLAQVPLMRGFQTVEQCSLEYNPARGASIDPHIDDCWIWGERIVTVNVLGDSILTMTPYRGNSERYNLPDVKKYPPVITPVKNGMDIDKNLLMKENVIVRLPMPARSLMILYGSSRYDWEHAVLRKDVTSRRVCIAYRELTPPYLPNGYNYEEAIKILENSTIFW